MGQWKLAAFGCFYLSASRNLNIPKDALDSLLKYRLVQSVQAGVQRRNPSNKLSNTFLCMDHSGKSGVLEDGRGSCSEVKLPQCTR